MCFPPERAPPNLGAGTWKYGNRFELLWSRVDRLKSAVGKELPEVKHSWRLEAMARGLGWRTFVTMRADLFDSTTSLFAVEVASGSSSLHLTVAVLEAAGDITEIQCLTIRVSLLPDDDGVKADETPMRLSACRVIKTQTAMSLSESI